jgi:hypothetical protein
MFKFLFSKYLDITIGVLSVVALGIKADPYSGDIFKVLRFTSKVLSNCSEISCPIQDPLTGMLRDIIEHEKEITVDEYSWASSLPSQVLSIPQETIVSYIFEYVFSLKDQCEKVIMAQGGYPQAYKLYGQLLKKVQKSRFFHTKMTNAGIIQELKKMSKADQQTILALYILHGEEHVGAPFNDDYKSLRGLVSALEFVKIYEEDDEDIQFGRLTFIHACLLKRLLLNENISLEHLHEFYDLHELEGTSRCIDDIFGKHLEIPQVYQDR